MSTPVRLNVYELIMSQEGAASVGKDALNIIGMGVFHTGVEIFGEEISFGMDPSGRNDPQTEGIFYVQPKTAQGNYKETIELGFVEFSRSQVQQLVETMKPQWRACTYHMLGRNCNNFTKALVEALGPHLLEKYPSGVNRIASTGNIIVPDLLLNKITKAISPPPACAPDLINKIHLTYQPPAPPPLPPQGPEPLPSQQAQQNGETSGSVLGGIFGVVKAVAKVPIGAVSGVIGSVIDEQDKADLVKYWPEIPPSELLDVYNVDVIHINRIQSSKLFVLRQGLGFKGSNQLKLQIAYHAICSIQYAKTKDAPEGNKLQPPTFDLINEPARADALLIFLQGGMMIPIFGIGSLIGRAGGLVSGNSPCSKLYKLIDPNWRKCAGLPTQ